MTKLTDEQQHVADRVQAVITAQRPDGTFKYSKEECRAFIVACVFDLGLPLPKELEGVFVRFLDQIKVPQDSSDEDVVAAIKAYFTENPLNDEMLAEMQALGRDEALKARDDYDTDAAAREQVARLRGTGQAHEARAPAASVAKAAAPKLKKGLGKEAG